MRYANRILPVTFALGVALSMPVQGAANAAPAAQAPTKISEADARKTALSAVASGSVQNAKLITDKGRQVWSFDLKSGASANAFNIQVDADTGRIVSKSVMTAGAQRPAKRDK